MLVSEKWHEKLSEKLKDVSPNYAIEIEREYVRIATLLHDVGHLPFSHLFEEIFDELHWVAFPHRYRPWHEVLSERKIEKLFAKNLYDGLNGSQYLMTRLGLQLEDVSRLIGGASGKPYLDAIVNSPVDADKIDYIFRDLLFLRHYGHLHSEIPGSVASLDPNGWLKDFFERQELSPDGLIRLNGRSALQVLDLLETRRDMYLKFYLAPELRAMERLTAFVLVLYLGQVLPEMLYRRAKSEGLKVEFDHGELKVSMACDVIIDKYKSLTSHALRPGCGTNGAPIKEDRLLECLLEELLDKEDRMDGPALEVVRAIQKHIGHFKVLPEQSGETSLGRAVRTKYDELHVAGPYYTTSDKEVELRELVRELILLYQGAVLIDVVKTPRFLSGASSRSFGHLSAHQGSLYGETFLVPAGKPSNWSIQSQAQVPLHTVDFGQMEMRYIQILVLDPCQNPAKARYVHQQFRRKCSRANIHLSESPHIVYRGTYGHH